MLPFDQLQMKLGKSVQIIRQPHTKIGVIIKEFGKIAMNFGRWVEPHESMCVHGCCHCCYGMPVLNSKLEFDYVQKEVKFNFFQTGPWMRKHGDKWREFAKIFGPTNKATLAAWRGAQIPCPMLNEEERVCVIYDNRPISCRIRWTPQYFLSDCFASSPIFQMMDGPAQASAMEISDPLIPSGPQRPPESPVVQIINNTLRDIDQWVFNFVGKPRPLIETIELLSGA
jgi:Fe-S-cluster containining protein